ncbi:MAG TPA: carboxylating nicotinate-nucleotide diphosphorylase, partial [Candidatus Hydrogenedentes bacterium]|nr:carboxylating nicotinate-nucleotide diphosphorylase [Candidatus Hydrogenedentota bacterium]
AKQNGVLSGILAFRAVFDCLDAEITDYHALADGHRFAKGDIIARFQGYTRAVLMGERVALNFLQHLSGIATTTARYVAAVEGLNVRLCDTRKTTPLLRQLEKQAVVHGGASNHRYALFDGVLIKENHIVGAGGIAKAVQGAERVTHHLMKIGVEVTNLDELEQAIEAGADAVLLDNMGIDEMRQAVERVRGLDVILEASGNITLERLRDVAATGVHVVSVGALTHSAPAVDISLEIANV